MEYCSKCRKPLVDRDGSSIIGISMQFETGSARQAFVQKQLGKYEIGKKYQFCFECFLDAIFNKRAKRREDGS